MITSFPDKNKALKLVRRNGLTIQPFTTPLNNQIKATTHQLDHSQGFAEEVQDG